MENGNSLELNRKKARRLFGLGDFGFPSMTNVESQFWTFFMTDVAMVPLGLMATIQTITGIIEMIMSPLYGVILSATRAGRCTRRAAAVRTMRRRPCAQGAERKGGRT